MQKGLKRVVTITGGSGGAVLLEGLRDRPVDIKAICTTFDDGGSTGRILHEYGNTLPAGDLRRCLWALAEPTIFRELLNLELSGKGSLSEHKMGNLILLGLQELCGDPIAAIRALGQLLRVHGEVLPISIDRADLMARYSDGSVLRGESLIGKLRPSQDARTIERVWLEPNAVICDQAYNAILDAEAIVIGPGDLYTSLVANLVVRGTADALKKAKSPVIFNLNLMTRDSETPGYDAIRFVEEIETYMMRRVQVVIANNEAIPSAILQAYWDKERAQPVVVDAECAIRLACPKRDILLTPLLSQKGLASGWVRHDSVKLSHAVMQKIL